MELTTFSGDKPTLQEALIAKNYLDEKELRAMGQIVSGYLDFAERKAERHEPMTDFGLIVTEYKKHSMENIQETIEQLNIAKLDKKAIVLNHCIHDSGAYGYGYGYGCGYRYRYRDK